MADKKQPVFALTLLRRLGFLITTGFQTLGNCIPFARRSSIPPLVQLGFVPLAQQSIACQALVCSSMARLVWSSSGVSLDSHQFAENVLRRDMDETKERNRSAAAGFGLL